MNRKELNIIRKTAEGIDEALQQLHGPDAEKHLYNAMVDMDSHMSKPLGSKIVGYYATMLLASENLRNWPPSRLV